MKWLEKLFRRPVPNAARSSNLVRGAERYSILVRGEAELLDCETDQPVTDAAILRQLDGRGEDYDLAQYIWPDQDPELHALGLSGGGIHLRCDDAAHRLWAESRYEVDRPLDRRELELVLNYTRGQWSDGAGENFDPCFKAGLPDKVVRLLWMGSLTATLTKDGEPLASLTQTRELALRSDAD